MKSKCLIELALSPADAMGQAQVKAQSEHPEMHIHYVKAEKLFMDVYRVTVWMSETPCAAKTP